MASYLEILCGIAALIVALYYYFTSTFDFWKVRGVPGPKPIPVLGNIKDVMLLRMSICHYLTNINEEFKSEPLVGIFTRRTPVLIVQDPDLIKDVLIKDFSKFADRGFQIHEKVKTGNQLNREKCCCTPLLNIISCLFKVRMRDIYSLSVAMRK